MQEQFYANYLNSIDTTAIDYILNVKNGYVAYRLKHIYTFLEISEDINFDNAYFENYFYIPLIYYEINKLFEFDINRIYNNNIIFNYLKYNNNIYYDITAVILETVNIKYINAPSNVIVLYVYVLLSF